MKRTTHRLGGKVGARASAGVVVLFVVGCADPCFDDGLAQGGCPERGTDATESADASQTEGASNPTEASGMDATTPGDETQGSGGAEGAECPELDEVLLPQVPTFQLVVDQSGSMNEEFSGGETRWEAMRTTLIDPADGVVANLQSSIRFGLSLYHTTDMGGMCPDVSAFPPQLDALDEITAILEAQVPEGETPTGESLQQIVGDLSSDPWEGEKIIVLTTDGEPDTCAIPDPMGADVDAVRQVAVDAVTSAYDMGIRTFVISVGTEIGADHLQALANAGVGNGAGDPDAEFWVANDTQALVDAFDAIVDGVRPCDFPLSKPLTAELAPSCEVTINDAPVPYEDANGWVLGDETTLELQGDACAALQQGVVTVKLGCTCVPQ